ncbi:umta methyltransferase family protein [Colletotrichum truncatum]|uniref:Umta methyltransferase family protein n=1 Tax=Colletotrichum truncatum TaxID=5467 RepID=A0ACC3YPP1_COLTU|nr:umta methyltransferase family protein [Colletotrichum truncatum]KAF6796854.1 umta methyltransferase family protein [Colletotrichum truncatum]
MADPLTREAPSTTGSPPTVPLGSPHATSTNQSEPVAIAVDTEPDQLEADDASTTDDASSIQDGSSSYTASLSSSIVDYPMHYGRRYHAYRSGSYPIPNDEHEMERLEVVHAMTVKVIGDKLFLAPIQKDRVNKILDIGTGTGIWAMEMGDLLPNAEIIGNDLSAIQPDWVPSNVKFEIDDVESPWLGNRKYDYIFCRYMLCGIGDWPKLVQNIFDHLNPGGWAEFQDMDSLYYSDDGTLTEKHATRKWNKQIVETMNSINRDAQPAPKLQGWVQDAGFQNIQHQRFKVPLGPWAKDAHFKEIGMYSLAVIMDGLEAFSMQIYCDVLGYTKEEVMVMLSEVRNEMKTLHTFHALWDLHVVYGQKPLEAETQEA